MKSYQQLFAELKRRKVFRVMAVYGATAFVVLQVADLLAEGMGLSDQVLRVTTFLVLIGFPIAIVLAWAFETTPDGVRLTEDATDEEIEAIIAQPASRRWMAGLLALAGIALLFGGWWLGQRGSGPPLNLTVPGAEAADFRTIAVLPFDDLGGNEENDPFLKSFHVAVIDRLTALGDLRVTQPASVQSYANSTKDTRAIAQELADVDYVLRGSVVRVGNQAGISVRLVDVRDNAIQTIKDSTVEVTVENLLDIQKQIARQIADRLQARLSPEDIQRLEAGLSTNNAEAINEYYRAREIYWSPDAGEGSDEVVAHVERAVELAPEFVEAWSFLAWMESNRYANQRVQQSAVRALEAVERTASLAPGSLETVKARGWYAYYVEGEFQRALDLMREVERKAPSDGDVLWGIAYLQHRLGQFAEGNRTMKRAVDLDPRNAGVLFDLANMLGRVAKWDVAEDVLERALAIDPSNALAQRYRVAAMMHSGDPGSARRLAAELGLDAANYGYLLSQLALLERDYDGAAQTMAQVPYDAKSRTARSVWVGVLARLVWVEQLRDGDTEPLLDSLRAFLGPDSSVAGVFVVPQAAARFLIGEDEAGTALLAGLVEDARSSADGARRTEMLWAAAATYAQFGKTEQALALLDDAVARPSLGWWSAAEMRLDPRYDSLRGDPRFDELVARQEAYEAAQAREAESEDWLP